LKRAAPFAVSIALLAVCVCAAGAFAKGHDPLRSADGGIGFVDHVFPVQASHGERGAVGEFGVPRSGGRVHEGFDILARCGARLVSVTTGKVREVGYDPILYGHYLLIHGQGEHRTYMYAHLEKPPLVREGERVFTGEKVGVVGKTGNARTVGCQLHFEIHVDGRPIDPKPTLDKWDAFS
jgi:murein DD-endopeptidase MepM/ murein hydrolase activator NlpD